MSFYVFRKITPGVIFEVAEHALQRLDLHRVADGRGRAVRLHEADRLRRDPGGLVRPPERQFLAFEAWRKQPHRTAVARDPDPADDGVNPVAVAFRVVEPLQHDHADTLTEQRAVGGGIERADLSLRRNRLELAEDRDDRRGR